MKLLIILLLFVNSAYASKYGMGFIVGNPAGLSGKYQLDKKKQIEAALSQNAIYSDLLLKDARNFDINGLTWLYGGGVFLKGGIGLRVQTQAEYRFSKSPFEIFSNIAFQAMKDQGLKLGVGAKYNF